MLGVTVGLAAIAVVLVPRVLPANPSAPYSSIALGGAWSGLGTAVYAKPTQQVEVQLQVENHTHRRRTYVVIALMKKSRWTGDRVTLEPGASWTGVVSGKVPAGGCLHRLAIALAEQGAKTDIGTLTVYLQSVEKLPKDCTQ